MGRPKLQAPKVVVATRISPDLEKRIKRLGRPTSAVVRTALEHGVVILEREHNQKLVLRKVDEALARGGPAVLIPELRQALPSLDPRSLDKALTALEARGEVVLRAWGRPDPMPIGGVRLPDRGWLLWIHRRHNIKAKAKPRNV
jgi:hypothetical protein